MLVAKIIRITIEIPRDVKNSKPRHVRNLEKNKLIIN